MPNNSKYKIEKPWLELLYYVSKPHLQVVQYQPIFKRNVLRYSLEISVSPLVVEIKNIF